MRLIMQKRSPLAGWIQVLLPLGAILLTLALSAVPILFAGGDLWLSYYSLFKGALGTRYNLLETFTHTAPLTFTGLAVAFAFRAKFWNIGAEGQLLAGAIAAAWVGINAPAVPRVLLLFMICLAGFLAGGFWATIPAFLKNRLKVDDVVSSLLLNYVMWHIMGFLLFGPMQMPGSSWPRSAAIAQAAHFPILLSRSRFHLGIILAAIAVLIVWFINSKTELGFQSRAVGANARAAAFSGINVNSVIFKTALISGGLAGMAGVGEVVGIHFHLLMDVSPGFGYSGIVIAMLGRLHPVGTALAAFFFSTVIVGAQSMSRMTGVPTYIADVIQALALLIMLIILLFTEYRVKLVRD
ncbi:MAG: Inner-membrane translocator [Synergistales bacterium 53_16]|nr:MAG: Inner-membrane translocator [Synergistales bacterium 53_16]KUL04762.1 MAG: Inner-membrane translocator [Synergistales bacterium 54_9]